MGEGDSEQSKPFDFDSTINVQDNGVVLDGSVLSSLGESLGDSSKEISNNLKDAATYSGDILKNVKAWTTPTEKQEDGKEENSESKISDNIITRVADRSVASSKEEAGKVKQLSSNISTNIPSGNVITEEDVAVQTEDNQETLKQRAVGFSTAFVNVLSRSQFGRAMLNAFNSIVSWGTMLYKGFSLVMGGLNSMSKGVFNAVLHPIETIKSMWSGLLVGIKAIGASIASAPVTWVLAIGGIVTSLLAYALNSFTDRESRVKYLEKKGYQVDDRGVVTLSSGKSLTDEDYKNIQDKTILDNIKKVNDTYVLKYASELSWESALSIAKDIAEESGTRFGAVAATAFVGVLKATDWISVIMGGGDDIKEEQEEVLRLSEVFRQDELRDAVSTAVNKSPKFAEMWNSGEVGNLTLGEGNNLLFHRDTSIWGKKYYATDLVSGNTFEVSSSDWWDSMLKEDRIERMEDRRFSGETGLPSLYGDKIPSVVLKGFEEYINSNNSQQMIMLDNRGGSESTDVGEGSKQNVKIETQSLDTADTIGLRIISGSMSVGVYPNTLVYQ